MLHPIHQGDDDTTGVSCPFRDKASYLFFFPAFWLARRGVWPESFEFSLQCPMTDLKDSSLSPLLQITSSDMFGHADNVLSENSFQGWMGYKLSTPRVGYFFNCCFIPLKRERQEGPERESRRNRQSSGWAGIKNCTRQWSTMNKSSLDFKRFGFTVWHRPVFSLSFSVSAVKTGGGRRQAGAEVCHCWHRQGRMPGQFSSVAVTGSTSVVWPVCVEAVPGRCMWSVSWAKTGFVSALCPPGLKSLSRTCSTALYISQILRFESV